jgi:hypothetical protein
MDEVWVGVMVTGNPNYGDEPLVVGLTREGLEKYIREGDGLYYPDLIIVGPGEEEPPIDGPIYWLLSKRRLYK